MNEFVCLVCIVFHVCAVSEVAGIELIPHPGKLSMSLCSQKSMYVIQRLICSPRQVVVL